MTKKKLNIAKEHAKTQGLGHFYVDVLDINKIVMGGVQNKGLAHDEILVLRDKVSALMGKLVTLETELDALDAESPCFKCALITKEKL